MADESNTNGAAGAQEGDNPQVQFVVQKIYLKDVSFEAPNSPHVFNEQGQSDVNLSLNQRVAKLADGVFEVVLGLTLTCKLGEKPVYVAEVQQAGIFGLTGFDAANADFMLGAHCPNMLFPYARQTISELIGQGGFPPFFLQPMNFEALYAESLRRRSEQAEKAESAPAGQA